MNPGEVLIERYRIERMLGRGGMGAVYLATHLELGTPVAIKEIRLLDASGHEDPQAVSTFRIEAQLLSRLSHPGLTRVHDFFAAAGHHYFVMDFVEGMSLADSLMTEGSPNEETLRQWIQELCDVLEYVHQHAIIFRDLKPSNVMVDRLGHLRLIDFGLAKEADATLGGTRTFIHGAGTPGYAAPEQYAGGTDVRTDIYALGATLYTVVTRLTPPQAIDIMVGNAALTPVLEANPGISGSIAAAIERLMMVDRALRPQSMAQVQALFGFREAAPGPEVTARLPAMSASANLTAVPSHAPPADDDATVVPRMIAPPLPTVPAAPPAPRRSHAGWAGIAAVAAVVILLMVAALGHRTATLEVTSSTPGALVQVDGAERGAVPLHLEVPAGAHQVRLLKDGSVIAEQQVSVDAGERRAIDFSVSGSHLQIDSDPPQAAVRVDGAEIGTASGQPLALTPGEHTVEVEKEGFLAQIRQVTVGVNQTISWSVRLQPVGAGLNVTGPAGATVYLDGSASGVLPLQIRPIAPGSHTLWMEADGHRSSGVTVQVPAGLNQDLTVSLSF